MVMKKESILKNGIKLIIFIVMIILFIYFGTKDYEVKVTDNIKFSNEYKDISKNNIFVYAKEQEILDIFNNKSGIIFMGFSSNIWSHYYADYLNQIAILNGIDKIYYYDFKSDRELYNTTYASIVNKLVDYLEISDVGKRSINAPTIVIVKNGEIIYFDDEVTDIKGNVNPEDYFTDYKKNLLMANLDNAIKEYLRDE
jgi:hypothetical protein